MKKEERWILRDAQEELSNVYRDVQHLVETLDLISKVLNQELEGFWANVRLGLSAAQSKIEELTEEENTSELRVSLKELAAEAEALMEKPRRKNRRNKRRNRRH